MCDALFFNKRAYENHNLFHKNDDVFVENEQERYEFILHNTLKSNLLNQSIHIFRQALVTRVDQDFDYRRVQTQTEKFIPKPDIANRGRKRKSEASATKPTSVRWVIGKLIYMHILILFFSFSFLWIDYIKEQIKFWFNFMITDHLFLCLKIGFLDLLYFLIF